MNDFKKTGWAEDIFHILNTHHVRQVVYVPDAGHTELIKLCNDNPAMVSVPLTTEEEGVALLAGAWLGGDRGVLLMQSSGVGNCLNMFSLTRVGRMPLLMFITMRGEWGEFNPWQVPMGQNTETYLKTANVLTFRAEHDHQVKETADAAAHMAFEGPAATAVLLSQSLIGAKTFEN